MKSISTSSNSLPLTGCLSSVHTLASQVVRAWMHMLSGSYALQNQFPPGNGWCSRRWSKSLGCGGFEGVHKKCPVQLLTHGIYAMGYKYDYIITN